MKIIDAHLHFSNVQRFIDTAKDVSKVDYSSSGLRDEFEKNDIVGGIVMGLTETGENLFPDRSCLNPMTADLEQGIPPELYYCIGINPYDLERKGIKKSLISIEKELGSHRAVGIKLYAGYYPVHISDTIYNLIYEIAEEHEVPVVIHTGDIFANSSNAEFSQPLEVNRLAVKYERVNFVIAHFGNPWVMDTAVVLSNTTNVYADLSGLFIGDEQKVTKYGDNSLFKDSIRRGLLFEENYQRVIFGSDWPLVPLGPYIDFIKQLIPEQYYDDVFYNNAKRVFRI